jgi:hypothetical protein
LTCRYGVIVVGAHEPLLVIVSTMPVVAVCVPEVAVMVTVDVPTVAVLLAVNVSRLMPVVGFVPKRAVTPLGRPDAASVTLPAAPETVIVSVALVLCCIESVGADGDRVKVPVPGTVMTMVAECVIVPSVPTIKTL